ncbi:MAG TPA: patatin-like phospholipase family protein, partial [Dongiaceae bacterium]|nr:patatin-like phospholipase family protein [Dongiaceae bacterium]
MPVRSVYLRGPLLSLFLILSGCTTLYAPSNTAIDAIDNSHGYRGMERPGSLGDVALVVSFSGGGTRAAALSYGVMQELRDTWLHTNGRETRLLDEVDHISSVSGGSFTAAYYGLFGYELFDRYEEDFLRQSVQGKLIQRVINPINWFNSAFSGMDRTEMAIDYYDKQIFRGKTFADMRPYPFIEINATDLSQGNRFAFTQLYFDLICSDLDSVKVASAVTASSAVPVLFPSVVLKNHAGHCDPSAGLLWPKLQQAEFPSVRERLLVSSLKSYQNAQSRPYIHLIDGGISDNLGLRATIDRLALFDFDPRRRERPLPRHVVVLEVNAQVQPERPIDASAKKPSVAVTVDAVSSAQIDRYTAETEALMESVLEQVQQQAEEGQLDMQFHLVKVNFQAVAQDQFRRFFNNLPTSLELTNDEITRLIWIGRYLLRESPEFRAFLASPDMGGVAARKVLHKKSRCQGKTRLQCLFQETGAVDSSEQPVLDQPALEQQPA